VRSHYPPERLARFLRKKAGMTGSPTEAAAEATAEDGGQQATAAPACATCGAPMVLRTAKRGRNAGNHFCGCSTYLQCRSMLAYEAGK
jgi:ssDNA-binding Zn-finger/Zn-ribbon topoisomerase 1